MGHDHRGRWRRWPFRRRRARQATGASPALASVAAVVLLASVVQVSLAAIPVGAAVRGDGLIAFRDAAGIGVVDPRSGQEHLLLAVPSACTSQRSGAPELELGGPVWAPSGSAGTSGGDLYFWLTELGSSTSPGCRLPSMPRLFGDAALLVRGNPATGRLRVVATAPAGLPCQPGYDLAATSAALAFTNGGCDEPDVEALDLPLRAGEQPVTARPLLPKAFCRRCAISASVLGSGPGGTVLYQLRGFQTPSPPPPSLQLFDPATSASHLLSRVPPPSVRAGLVAAATSPGGDKVAFAGSDGAGVLDLRGGRWAPLPLPTCARGCRGATAVSFSPSGTRLALAAGNGIVVDPLVGGSPEVLLAGSAIAEVSWSGPIAASALGRGAPVPVSSALGSLWAPFVAAGTGPSARWQVGPALPSGMPALLAALPGRPSALLMISDHVALAAGTNGSMWRSTDGGAHWRTVTAHCIELQMVTRNFPPCGVTAMARPAKGVVLAGGTLGLWRSDDAGRSWRRETFPGKVVEGGPFASGSTALVLVAPAKPSGLPVVGAPFLTLLVSNDGGRRWSTDSTIPRRDPDRGAGNAFFDRLFVLAPGVLAAFFRTGDCSLPQVLRVSTDAGRRWHSIALGRVVLPSALGLAAGSRLVLASAFCGSAAPRYGQGIFLHGLASSGSWTGAGMPEGFLDLGSTGATRFPASSPVTTFSIEALAFPDATTGVAVGSEAATVTDRSGLVPAEAATPTGQLVLASGDGGRRWSEVPAPGGNPLTLVSCADATHCLAGGPTSDELVRLAGFVADPTPRATPGLARAGRLRRADTTGWPALVVAAMAHVAGRTRMPLRAPRVPLPVASGPNSAKVSASGRAYDVQLYRCRRPPVSPRPPPGFAPLSSALPEPRRP